MSERPPRGPSGIPELLVFPGLLVLFAAAVARSSGARLAEPAGEWAFALGWLAIALLFAPRLGLNIRGFFHRPARPRDWWFALSALPLLTFAVTAMYVTLWAMSQFAPAFVSRLLAEPDGATTVASPLMHAVTALVPAAIGPAVEEIVFRGMLLQLWARRWGLRRAVIGTSLLFAALHVSEPLSGFVFSLVMIALYVGSGSLLVPIATHVLHNTIIAVSSTGGEEDGTTTLASFHEHFPIAALTFALALALIVMTVRRAAPRPWMLPALPPLPPLAAAHDPSLVPQGGDGIEPGGAAGRIDAQSDAA